MVNRGTMLFAGIAPRFTNYDLLFTSNTMDKNRLLWASRRGMLELDLVLQPFIERTYPQLSPQDQQCYCRLLEQEDQDLFAWFIQREQPSDPDLQRIVDIVLTSARQRRD
jgi:antitoxin CptB